ncbi:MAG: hypothetical protein ABIB79_02305 [archaeon]
MNRLEEQFTQVIIDGMYVSFASMLKHVMDNYLEENPTDSGVFEAIDYWIRGFNREIKMGNPLKYIVNPTGKYEEHLSQVVEERKQRI